MLRNSVQRELAGLVKVGVEDPELQVKIENLEDSFAMLVDMENSLRRINADIVNAKRTIDGSRSRP